MNPLLLMMPVALATSSAAVPANLTGASAIGQARQNGPDGPRTHAAAVDSTATAAASDAEVQALRADLDEILRRPGWADASWSVMAVSLDRGDTLFARGAGRPLTPASNVKLFTTAAALRHLGPAYRYSTYLIASGPIRDGVLHGDLIVYGTGDPTLSGRFHHSDVAVWERFADDLAALGISAVRGDLVGDGSYFDGRQTGVGWHRGYMDAWYAAPAGALSFHDNVVTLHVLPAEESGWRPEVRLVPGGRGIAIVNQATTIDRGGSRVRVERAAYDGPIVIRGQIGRGHPGIWRRIPVADPARYAVAAFADVLREHGLELRGEIRSVHRRTASPVTGHATFAPSFEDEPPLQVLAVHRSPSLIDVLEVINGESHNFYAEMVLRTVGRVATGDGSIEGGARAIEAMLRRPDRRQGLPLRIVDGSGLSTFNRASARTITTLLADMARSPLAQTFWSTLPVAGDYAGLGRMYRTAAAGNLRAKTGTIRGVSALSGYVRAANGEVLAFSVISNDVPSTWMAKRVEDAIGARLAEFDRPATAPVARSGSGTASPVAHRIDPDSTGEDAAPRFHIVRPGDTLEAIALRYGTTVPALQAANAGIEPRRLVPGRRLRLPDR
ncbi:MAG: D-alanyl-D-alanine carboxypeptidase/D-alanyl-D-alanine-endopeptidase [Gemmatimonadota bacterium]